MLGYKVSSNEFDYDFIWVGIWDIYVIDLRNLKWCMSDWYALYVNDMCCFWLMKACINLIPYIWGNVWNVVYWYIKCEKPTNRDPLASLMVYFT